MVAKLPVSSEKIADFCRRSRIRELSLFGSVLRDDFRPDSDVDVLVTFDPDAKPGVLDLVRMQAELENLFGRRVDLIERRAVEQSDNYIRRKHILQTAEVIYGP